MSFVRNVWADLRDKKLWPVAVALLVALVAVPVLLGRGGSATPATDQASAPAPAPVVATPASIVKVADAPATGKVQRSGKVHDPFVQQHQAKVPDTVRQALSAARTALTGAAAGSGSASSGSGAPHAGGSGSPSTPAPATTPATAPKPSPIVYQVDLRFGRAGIGKLLTNVARLTPLPSADDPFFVFLGVTKDGKSAVFMISNDAQASGDGTCNPSPDNCRTITMVPGDTEFLDLQDGTAGLIEYQLDLKRIRKGTAASFASAAKAHARESRAGRDYLRDVISNDPAALSDWQWSEQDGLLVDKAAKADAKSAGAKQLASGSAG